ncbi:YlcI/YnfO family protein [Streptococcus suis]|uniref:YlcI/YnfO family protein n=1 Tax=Streptococcus suis TaxID=1307 RepID=A0AAW9DI96_STRSU|nr:YlcI/YnfO family protein [Streptococcus suis]MDX5038728.1 YlcI/YnfO family protein [Streptococcus suis]
MILTEYKLKSDKKETEIKTIRFPSELVDRIEEAIVKKDVSFSSFVIQACDYALNNMDKEQ